MKLAIIVIIIVISFLLISCSDNQPPVITNITSNINQSAQDAVHNETILLNNTEEIIEPSNAYEENQESSSCMINFEEKCIGPTELPCSAIPQLDVNNKEITFSVVNEIGADIQLVSIETYAEEAPWDCMTHCKVESAKVSVESGPFVDVSSEPQIFNTKTAEFMIKCSNITDYVNQGFELKYLYQEQQESAVGYYTISVLG